MKNLQKMAFGKEIKQFVYLEHRDVPSTGEWSPAEQEKKLQTEVKALNAESMDFSNVNYTVKKGDALNRIAYKYDRLATEKYKKNHDTVVHANKEININKQTKVQFLNAEGNEKYAGQNITLSSPESDYINPGQVVSFEGSGNETVIVVSEGGDDNKTDNPIITVDTKITQGVSPNPSITVDTKATQEDSPDTSVVIDTNVNNKTTNTPQSNNVVTTAVSW